MDKPLWYSIDENLATCDHHAVGLEEALAIVRDYFGTLRPYYETAEEGLAATMFGFSRSYNDFIEIGINSKSNISIAIELPGTATTWMRRLWQATFRFRHEETVLSPGMVEEWVRLYFTVDPNEMRSQLSHLKRE